MRKSRLRHQIRTFRRLVQAKDAAGNTATATVVSVTVSNTVSGTPPVISAVTASGVQSTSANITWTTDKVATSQVDYGTTAAFMDSAIFAAPPHRGRGTARRSIGAVILAAILVRPASRRG